VLALGPVADVGDDGNAFGAVNWRTPGQCDEEIALRSPGDWLRGIRSPTSLIEGLGPPGNASSLHSLCASAKEVAVVHCLWVPGHDHFSVVQAVARVAAQQTVMPGPDGFALPAGVAPR
jgi:hypothetical protein